jgi:5'-3' exonuclease
VKPTKTVLLVDLSYQTYRAAAAHPMLTSGRHFTGGLYGFMTTIAKIIRETNANEVVFCSDVKPYLRSQLYPEYKQIRKKSADDELIKMFKSSYLLVTGLLQEWGFPIWGIQGFESDDLIAHAAIKYRHRYKAIYAASNDSDLFQLLWIPNFFIYAKDMASLHSGQSVMTKHGVTPAQFMLSTALQGTHNDVAGIPKVGPVTALKAIKDPVFMRALREKHHDLIERNLKLIKLPHDAFPRSEGIPRVTGIFDQRLMIRTLGRFDIDVTQSMLQSFEQVHNENLPRRA